ncbi:MAG TPA: TonB-dependent receptor [Novosphingobium sp.]|nr:TonB-dependent receptor [Novosphingobium sp.]
MNGSSRKSRLLCGCAAGLTFSLMIAAPQNAVAQQKTAAEADKTDDGTIIVTARRREERLQDVPVSVVAFGGEQLQQRSVRGLEDVAALAPGLRIEPQNNKPSTVQITLRGLRMYGVISSQDSPNAFYFADTAVAPIQGFNSAMYDLASIQVLKGPQGTLFGRNTTGGAVLVTPAKPTQDLTGSLTLRAGNYETRGAQGYINVPLGDTLAVRFSGYYNRHDGYFTYENAPLTGKKGGADENLDLRFSALWQPADGVENHFIAYYAKLDNTVLPSTIVAINPVGSVAPFYDGTGANSIYPNVFTEIWDGHSDPRKVYGRFAQYDRTKVKGLVNTTVFELGSQWQLKNIAAYRHVYNTSLMDINGVGAPILASFQISKNNFFSDELQISASSLFDRVDLTAGLYYSSLKSDEDQASITNWGGSAPGFAPFNAVMRNRSSAAYVQATAKVIENLSFTAGGRVTHDKRLIDWTSQTFPAFTEIGVPAPAPACRLSDDNGVALTVNACSISGKVSYTKATYTLSLDYHITPDVMVYVTQRTGYRSGGFNQRAYTLSQRRPYAPETILSREVGLKAQFDLGSLTARFNAAYHHSKLKSLQKAVAVFLCNNATPPVCTSSSEIVNAGAGTVKGVELDFQIDATRILTLGANYSYTKTAYSSFDVQLRDPVTQLINTYDFSDREFAGIPRHQASIFATIRPPLPESVGEFSMTADWFYNGKAFINELYQRKADMAVLYTPARFSLIPDISRPHITKAYQLINVRADLKKAFGSPVDIGLYVKNLTNEDAEVGASAQYPSTGVAAVTMGPPRTFGVELTFGF